MKKANQPTIYCLLYHEVGFNLINSQGHFLEKRP